MECAIWPQSADGANMARGMSSHTSKIKGPFWAKPLLGWLWIQMHPLQVSQHRVMAHYEAEVLSFFMETKEWRSKTDKTSFVHQRQASYMEH